MRNSVERCALEGFKEALAVALSRVEAAAGKLGDSAQVSYPDTNYYLPVIYGMVGNPIRTIGELRGFLRSLTPTENPLDAGLSWLYLAESVEAIRYALVKDPYAPPYVGFIGDSVLRKLGSSLAHGTIAGIAVIVGKAKDLSSVDKLTNELRSRSIFTLLIGPIVDQFRNRGIRLDDDQSMVAVGTDITSAIHAVSFAVRAALSFGAIPAGRRNEVLKYLNERVPLFVLALGPLDPAAISLVFGVVACGAPVVTDQPMEGVHDLLLFEPDYTMIVSRACEARGIKTSETKIQLPVGYGPSFQGEVIRRERMFAEFGHGRSIAFEVLRVKPSVEVENGSIQVLGLDLDNMKEGEAYPLAIIVDVAGSKIEKDFEPALERRIHQFLNQIEGVMHVNQRDTLWVRVSKDAVKKGLTMKDLGTALYSMYHNKFPTIVDKVQITLTTDLEMVERDLASARKIYEERDGRINGLAEEEVDSFYGCALCQSFAPNHICVITPERISLCGATSWLDARIANKLDPTGPSFEIRKGTCINPEKGEWAGVNAAFFERSHKTIERCYLHSIFELPTSSCGCFEAIAFYVPEVDGIGIVDREFKNATVNGMSFSKMAGFAGGGRQMHGFLGIGIGYLRSGKFLQADGGWKRVVWMPNRLKELVKTSIPADAVERIATEVEAKNLNELCAFLEKRGVHVEGT